MERLHFEILIDAQPETVYNAITASDHFEQWTSVFSPTSRYEGNWEKGSKIKFLSTNKDGSISGMVSRIKENIPNEHISIEHLGFIQNGKEITEGEEAQAFKGALENYTLIKKGDLTELQIDSDSFSDYKEYFLKTWPKALQELKSICESKNGN